MAIPVWPSTLPFELLQRGYTQAAADTTLKTSMDAGPSKIRRRYTAGVESVTGTLILSEPQLTTIRYFYKTTLKGGSLRFTWVEPVSLTNVEFRFTGPVQWSMSGGWYEVSLELEILP